MPVISFANPKGGAGKTTLAMIMAQTLSGSASVAVIDADPNRIIAKWSDQRKEEGRQMPFEVVSKPSEKEMVATVKSLSTQFDYVLIDLEGTASRLTSRALARSHIVLIPMNASPIDANMASLAVDLIVEEEEALEKNIPFRIVMSRTSAAVRSRSMKRILAELESANIRSLPTHLNEMAAFRDIFEFGLMLSELDPMTTSSTARASEIASLVMNDLLEAIAEEYT